MKKNGGCGGLLLPVLAGAALLAALLSLLLRHGQATAAFFAAFACVAVLLGLLLAWLLRRRPPPQAELAQGLPAPPRAPAAEALPEEAPRFVLVQRRTRAAFREWLCFHQSRQRRYRLAFWGGYGALALLVLLSFFVYAYQKDTMYRNVGVVLALALLAACLPPLLPLLRTRGSPETGRVFYFCAHSIGVSDLPPGAPLPENCLALPEEKRVAHAAVAAVYETGRAFYVYTTLPPAEALGAPGRVLVLDKSRLAAEEAAQVHRYMRDCLPAKFIDYSPK